MKSSFARTLAAAALVFAAAAAAAPRGAQRSAKPSVTAEVGPERERDAKLEAAIRDPDGDGDPDNYDTTGESWTSYHYNRVDLNGDGRPETLVHLFGPYMCGSGGCNTLVFRQTRAGDYRLVSDVALTRNPVIVSERRTNGWNDLIVFVSGGGINPGYYAVLRFDGKSYPNNATAGRALPLRGRARGRAYLVGDNQRESGFPL